jgi:1-deoxy-D-xylulose-5-phosphate synthase
MIVTAPKDGAEMLALLRLGAEQDVGPFSLRYPRDNVPEAVPPLDEIPPIEIGSWEVLRQGSDLALLAVGTMVQPALEAARLLESHGYDATVVNCRFLKPYDEAVLAWVAERHAAIVTIEEGTIVNGFGAMIARVLEPVRQENPGISLDTLGIPDRLVHHATREEQLEEVGLTPRAIAERAHLLAGVAGVMPVRETA